MKAHPSSAVAPKASIAADVEIGPFCIVGPDVRIGSGSVLMSRVHINGRVTVGKRNLFHPTAVIGQPPQELSKPESEGRVEIGDDNIFREAVTVQLSMTEEGVTRIGNRNRFYYGSHVGHDCEVDDDVILDDFGLSGHSRVESGATAGAIGGTHPYAIIGKNSRILSHVMVNVDAPPYMIIDGNDGAPVGLNLPALRGLSHERVLALEEAYRVLYKSDLSRQEALKRLEKNPTPEVREIIDSVRASIAGRSGRAREGEK